jgi:ribosomal protein S18 acetylase RimI-like enzyme
MQPAHRIRTATAEDIPALADLSARTFRETFEKQNAPADIATYLERSFSMARIQMEFEDPANTFLLAFTNRSLGPIGYAKLRSGEVDPAVKGPNPLELERLYVGSSAIGQGIGAELMKRCLEQAQRRGHETLWLGVWEHNPRAIMFYERWGFVKVGVHDFLLGLDEQSHHETSGGSQQTTRSSEHLRHTRVVATRPIGRLLAIVQ